MKKLCIIFILLFIITLTAVTFNKEDFTRQTDYFRIHVRANSNSKEDQSVKYEVKESVVNYLTPFICNAESKSDAVAIIKCQLKNVESIANAVLKENGFSYTASAEVKSELFPLRVYGDITLKEGVYDSLILNLGSGEGDNWWCVIYPPLCFTDYSGNIVYRSKIYEMIKEYFS